MQCSRHEVCRWATCRGLASVSSLVAAAPQRSTNFAATALSAPTHVKKTPFKLFSTPRMLLHASACSIEPEEGGRSLRRPHTVEGNEATDTTASVLRDQQQISDAYAKEVESQLTWWELLSGRSNAQSSTLRHFLLGLGAQIVVQLSGINTTSYYLPTVLQSPSI